MTRDFSAEFPATPPVRPAVKGPHFTRLGRSQAPPRGSASGQSATAPRSGRPGRNTPSADLRTDTKRQILTS